MTLHRSLGRSLAAVLSVGSILLATACASDDVSSKSSSSSSPAADQGDLTIASQSFGEAALVAEMYKQLLSDAGYNVDVKLVSNRDGYIGIFPQSVDVVPEYVGGIVNELNARANGDDAKPFEAGDGEQLAADGKQLLDDAGITLLDVSAATDTNAFFVTQEYSESEGVTKLSDLSGTSVVLAAHDDCQGRLDCEAGLSGDYGIKISKLLPLGYATAQTYKSVLDDESQLGETSTTDGTLASQGLVVLEDDKQIQPAQNLVPAVGTEFLADHPDVADVLNPLMAALTTEKLTELNGRISVDREDPTDVATDFLTSEGLL